ncbi:type II toxin-antitoxin system CcdA family antitoxin [Rhizobium sp. L43]|uniref:type II toxin-antitoxin system CcdA family antitoxin n=1 Tax=Rhizobium sp. L43 TaxID=2035452 RepID=UPI000BEAD614|nr:type II toxin-antitoxin system CcdA family antitoxin [Rhizobium sp. L43]PDS80736.1 post-segregation antitoxin CcdA [Rhizobium sp. L43]
MKDESRATGKPGSAAGVNTHSKLEESGKAQPLDQKTSDDETLPREERERLWRIENAEAIAEQNEYVAKHGLPFAKYRQV